MSEPVRRLSDVDSRVPTSVASPPMGVPSGSEASSSGPARERGSARQRVLDVAAELFGSRGYERTPLRVVADSLGLSKAAIYYHFKAKEDLLLAMVSPVLDRIDELIDSAGPGPRSSSQRRRFLAGYVDELTGHAGIVALLLRDPGVAEHAVGRRFVSQHARMRQLLGAGDEPASVIRTNTALLALELAVVEFGDADPDDVRETALDIAVSVLESGRS